MSLLLTLNEHISHLFLDFKDICRDVYHYGHTKVIIYKTKPSMKIAKENRVCNVDNNYESRNNTTFDDIFEYDAILWAAIPKNGE